MKKTKRFLIMLLCLFAVGVLFTPVFASETVKGELSASTLQSGDTFTLTVSIKEITASSLGVAIECDDSLEILDGKWLKSGLIASYDPVKNKGAYTAGAAHPISGDIFEITFRAKNPSADSQSIKVTVIAKNSSVTILDETLERSVTVICTEHVFSDYVPLETKHSRKCTQCDYTEENDHVWNKGSVTVDPTCEKYGEKVYTCTECSFDKAEKIDKSAHTVAVKGEKSSTCSEEGYTGDKVCSVCNELVEKGNTLPKLSHKETVKVAKTATCTEQGYTGDKVCSVCNVLIEKGSAVAKTSHKYSEGFCLNCDAKDPSAPSTPENTKPITTTNPTTTTKPVTTKPTIETTAPVITGPPTTTPSVTTDLEPSTKPDVKTTTSERGEETPVTTTTSENVPSTNGKDGILKKIEGLITPQNLFKAGIITLVLIIALGFLFRRKRK